MAFTIVIKYFTDYFEPKILKFQNVYISNTSKKILLYITDCTVGCQQGDLLGPVSFSLAIHLFKYI